MEQKLNQLNPSTLELDTKQVFLELIHLIHSRQPKPLQSDCLIKLCLNLNQGLDFRDNQHQSHRSDCETGCQYQDEFQDFFYRVNDTLSQGKSSYSFYISGLIEEIFDEVQSGRRRKRSFEQSNRCQSEAVTNCTKYVRDFRFVKDLKRLFPTSQQYRLYNMSKSGTLLNILFSSLENEPNIQVRETLH